jgi:hypothetical protein
LKIAIPTPVTCVACIKRVTIASIWAVVMREPSSRFTLAGLAAGPTAAMTAIRACFISGAFLLRA